MQLLPARCCLANWPVIAGYSARPIEVSVPTRSTRASWAAASPTTATPSVGGYQVGFTDAATNSGYYSAWPQWAFGLAQAALLAGKDVQLVANGLPFGSNLLNVTIEA